MGASEPTSFVGLQIGSKACCAKPIEISPQLSIKSKPWCELLPMPVHAGCVMTADRHILIFDDNGPFVETVICLSGVVAVQLALPLFKFGPL